jgi:hypothetical protein
MPPRAEGRSPSHAGSIRGRFGALARALLPALSTDPASDLTGRANGHERVLGVLERHRRELQSLVPNGAGTGMTRLSCWSPAARDDRPDLTHAGDFALSRGVPSGLSSLDIPEDHATGWAALDYAVSVSVPDETHLPWGPLYLDGVPVVVRIIRPRSLMPLQRRAESALG